MKRHWIGAGIVAVLFSAAAIAAEAPPDLPTRVEYYHLDYRLNDDASAVATYSWAVKVLQDRAVDSAKQTSISYSTSIETADVLEAYTRKPDGRRIDSAKSSFQVNVNRGKGKDAPAISDRTSLTAIFPEVETGDTVVFSYRITQKEPMFPGHFSVMDSFSRSAAYDDVRIRIDAPAALWAQHEAPGLMEVSNVEKNGRRLLEWQFQNRNPVRSKRRDYSVYDALSEPGFAYSTFRSYAQIAEAYGERARPKAAVTERVRKLAQEIVGEQAVPREQARLLYDWVATNISYAGNCIGVGAVVPRDIDFILDNRMGDCKDHATLLQSLLAASGIASTQALVNAGSGFRLPKTPVVSYVNHVINYIPSLDLYADSTAADIPFGMLPFAVAGKPVLLTEGYSQNTRTPAPKPGSNGQRMSSKLKVHDDGSVSGAIEVQLDGMYATQLRAQFRELPKDAEAELIENMFRKWGRIGSGSFQMEDPKALVDRFGYQASIEMKDYLQWPGSGAFTVAPLLLSPAPVLRYFAAVTMPNEEVDVACSSGRSEENYEIELPKGMKILALPDKAELANDFLSYSASYRLKGSVLHVRRVFDDRTPGNVCSPALMAEYRTFAAKAQQNFKSQVVYK